MFCGAPWNFFQENDLSPCFEFSLRLMPPAYLLGSTLASLRSQTSGRSAKQAGNLNNSQFAMLGAASVAAANSLVMLLLNSFSSIGDPEAFTGAPVFMLHFSLFAFAWTVSCASMFINFTNRLPVPTNVFVFAGASMVLDLKRLESNILRVVQVQRYSDITITLHCL